MKQLRLVQFILFYTLIFVLSCSTILQSTTNFPQSTVVLTFDYGPNRVDSTTLRLLCVLKKHQIKAHFCLIGTNISQHPQIVREIFLGGHNIVNHGLDDKSIVFKDNRHIINDIDRWLYLTKSVLGTDSFTCSYYRPPYGIYKGSLVKILAARNLHILPISFYVLDAQKGPDKKFDILNATLKNIRKSKGGVIVLHDGRDSHEKLLKETFTNAKCSYNRQWIPEITDSLITILKKENYRFLLLSEAQ